LSRNGELPSPQSLAQFAERLLSTPDTDVGEAVLALQLGQGVRADDIEHLMFLFTSNNPGKHVTADLESYRGSVSQLTIILRVQGHQQFIQDAYAKVTADGP
jgi:hypothetical protein